MTTFCCGRQIHLFLIWTLLITHSLCYILDKNIQGIRLTGLFKRTLPIRDLSYDDKPLILSQNREKGKENEVVLSTSETFGINKILHDSTRRNLANEPLFKVGSMLYVRTGTLRSSRCTVLDIKPSHIGEPYMVLVSLDCRNADGIIRNGLSEYHGTSIWLKESDLVEHEVFSPLAPPLLDSDRVKNVVKKGPPNPQAVYNTRLINTVSHKEVEELYYEMVSKGYANSKTPFIALTQLARAHEDVRVYSYICGKLHNDLLDHIYKEIVNNGNLPIVTVIWTFWSIVMLCSFSQPKTAELAKSCVLELEKYFKYSNLKKLDWNMLNRLAWSYVMLGTGGNRIVYDISEIISKAPVADIQQTTAGLVAFALHSRDIVNKSFVKKINEVILKYPNRITISNVPYYLGLFSNLGEEYRPAYDKLVSIFFSDEGPDRPINRINDDNFFNLLSGLIKDKDYLEIFKSHIYGENPTLSPRVIEMSLRLFHDKSIINHPIQYWIVKRVMDNIDTFAQRRIISFVYFVSLMNECPTNFDEVIYNNLVNMEVKKNHIHNCVKAYLGFVAKFPYKPEIAQVALDYFENLVDDSITVKPQHVHSVLHLLCKLRSFIDSISCFPANYPKITKFYINSIKNFQKTMSKAFISMAVVSASSLFDDIFTKAAEFAKERLSHPDAENHADPSVEVFSDILLKMYNDFYQHFKSPNGSPASDMLVSNEGVEIEDDPKINVKWIYSHFRTLVEANLIEDFDAEGIYNYTSENIQNLTNADVSMLVDSLNKLNMFDGKWKSLIKTIPKGISAIV